MKWNHLKLSFMDARIQRATIDRLGVASTNIVFFSLCSASKPPAQSWTAISKDSRGVGKIIDGRSLITIFALSR